MIKNEISKNALFLLPLIILVACGSAHAETDSTIECPAFIKKLDVQITQQGVISVGGTIDSMELTLMIPQQTENQKVEQVSIIVQDTQGNQLDHSWEKIRDKAGNSLAQMKIKNPPNKIKYILQSYVTASGIKTMEIPQGYSIPSDVSEYLKPTSQIQSNDPKIRELAAQITKDCRDDFEKIAKLAIWIDKNIQYDKSIDTPKDALWVLDNKRGVCNEFAILFAALSRSLGIPTRFVSGNAYGNRTWEGHAWAEVYLGKWVPVDPTWLEVGNLDATHIKFAVGNDSVSKDKVKVWGIRTGGIEWSKEDTDIKILNVIKKDEPEIDNYTLSSSAEVLGVGGESLVLLEIPSTEYVVLTAALLPCSGDFPVIYIENKEKEAILKPGRRHIITWQASASTDLDPAKIYTCPLTLNSKYLKGRVIDLTVDPRVREKIEIKAELSKNTINIGEEEIVYLDLSREEGSGKVSIGFIAEDMQKEEEIYLTYGESRHLSFSFKPEKLGRGKVHIYTSLGDVKTLDYAVREEGDIFISDIKVPQILRLDEKTNITISIKNNRKTMQNLKLYVNIQGQQSQQNILVGAEATKQIIVPFIPYQIGINKIIVEIKGYNMQDSRISETLVYGIPQVSIQQSTSQSLDGQVNASFLIKVENGELKNLEVKIAGHQKKVGYLKREETINFLLPPGKYNVTLSWEDLGGKRYSAEKEIEVKKEGFVVRMIKAFIDLIEGILTKVGITSTSLQSPQV